MPVQAVALRDQPVPGGSGEVFVTAPVGALISSRAGVVGFVAQTRLPNGQLRSNIFGFESGALMRIATEGTPLPGLVGESYGSFAQPLIDDLGRYTFSTQWSAPGLSAVVTGAPGQLQLVAHSIFGAPAGPWRYMSGIPSVLATNSGTLLLTEGPDNSPPVYRFWSGAPGALQNIFSTRTPAPGYPAGVTVSQLGPVQPTNSGAMVGLGLLQGGAVDGRRIDMLASGSSQTIFAGPGLSAPGLGGTMIEAGNPPTTNGAGIIAFQAPFEPSGGGPVQQAAWVGTPGSFQPIAVTGQQVPGLAGFRFTGIDSPALNRRGDAAFFASARHETTAQLRTGFYRSGPQGLDPLLVQGMPVANLPPGSTYVGPGGMTLPGNSAFNDAGQLALTAFVSIPGVPGQPLALLATDLDGSLKAIAATGFPFQVASGDVRTVSGVYAGAPSTVAPFVSGDDGRGTFFSDAGQLVFKLDFSDGTWGVFVGTIPSPGTSAMLMGACLIIGPTRRRGASRDGGRAPR
jgi:hypothetical protein